MASRNACAIAESVRYSRLGPAHRRLYPQMLMPTMVPSWNIGPPESPGQMLVVTLMYRSGKASCVLMTVIAIAAYPVGDRHRVVRNHPNRKLPRLASLPDRRLAPHDPVRRQRRDTDLPIGLDATLSNWSSCVHL